MRLLHLHNHYRIRGGEDAMFEQICGMLRERGHAVTTYQRHSADIGGADSKLRAALAGVYSPVAAREVRRMLQWDRPDVAHVHNLFPLISPSAIQSCHEQGVPVVMRCPNYRLICPTGILLRNGKPCEQCVGGREYRCALLNCRGSRFESFAMAGRSYLVRTLGLVTKYVARYVAPSQCVRQRLVDAGIAAERVDVIPNIAPLAGAAADASRGQYIAYAGRLSSEKGVETLLEAARQLPHVPVHIAGEGELYASLKRSAPGNVVFEGQLNREGIAAFYAKARMCVVPSIWHEAFGLVAAEAMAIGLPVVASRIGALPEIVDDGRTGLLFEPGDSGSLAATLERLWANPRFCRVFGSAGRDKVLREYSRDVYYRRLMRVYERALGTTESVRVGYEAGQTTYSDVR